MKKLLIVLLLPLAGCYGNLMHSQRMYDSAMKYSDSLNHYYNKALVQLYSKDSLALHKSDSLRTIADRFSVKMAVYSDSFYYYCDRRFEREVKK